jgi:hypothetical protein
MENLGLLLIVVSVDLVVLGLLFGCLAFYLSA